MKFVLVGDGHRLAAQLAELDGSRATAPDLSPAGPGLQPQVYEQTKRRLVQTYSQDPDYDRYTIAKTPFFDMIQSTPDA